MVTRRWPRLPGWRRRWAAKVCRGFTDDVLRAITSLKDDPTQAPSVRAAEREMRRRGWPT